MAENFKFNRAEYASYADKIKLNVTQKNILISKMQQAVSKDTKVYQKSKYRYFTKAVAAVLSLAIIGGVFCFLGGIDRNSFIMTANASEILDTETQLASSEMTTGFNMQMFSESDSSPYLNKYGKRDIFHDFLLTDLTIKGENIESVTFEANRKSTYFNLFTDNYENKFTDIKPLTNSQYSKEEFEKYYDGFFGYVCDGFTYLNTNGHNEITLGRLVGLKVESDYSDSEIASWMDTVYECFEKNEEYQSLYAPENKIDGMHYVTEEEIANYRKQTEYMDKVIDKTLNGATVDITVKFTDGSEQRKTLVLGYDNSGEVSFLTAKAL